MISEKAICELFSSMLPSGRANDCFESDAEIISLNGTPNGLFTTDEFSAEDLFRENDPYLLGWNIAAGAISDILACGGVPLYYAHALTVDPRWDAAYLRGLGTGVRDVLKATGARFIGGDCGRSEVWRCTVSVIGWCEGAPVRRRGARPGDLDLFVRGDWSRESGGGAPPLWEPAFAKIETDKNSIPGAVARIRSHAGFRLLLHRYERRRLRGA